MDNLQDNVKQALTDSLSSYRDTLFRVQNAGPTPTLYQFVFTGVSETGNSYLSQLENDSRSVN